jgi:hypothetical protein
VHAKVFSEEEAQRFPNAREWDHAIDLRKDAPATLPGKIYAITQPEKQALKEFISEHLKKKYIRPSKSPYAAPFFFIKRKTGNSDRSKTTENSTNGRSRIVTHSP